MVEAKRPSRERIAEIETDVALRRGNGLAWDRAADLLNELSVLRARVAELRGVVEDVPDTDHALGCNGAYGPQYNCKCGAREWLPRYEKALAVKDE